MMSSACTLGKKTASRHNLFGCAFIPTLVDLSTTPSILLPGGCCFKPQTAKEGLRLFEIETVLSLEQRALKEKLEPSSISEVSCRRSLSTILFLVMKNQRQQLFTLSPCPNLFVPVIFYSIICLESLLLAGMINIQRHPCQAK